MTQASDHEFLRQLSARLLAAAESAEEDGRGAWYEILMTMRDEIEGRLAVPPPPPEGTVRVRVAVAVSTAREYDAFGRDGWGDEQMAAKVRGVGAWERGARLSFITADVPLPAAAEVEGRCEGG